MLHLEAFDPHEPFRAPQRFRDQFPTGYQGPILDWPRYGPNELSEEETAELRANYATLVALCDEQLGRLLEDLDQNNDWDDTAVILTMDHGFLLGEHEWWARTRCRFIMRLPIFR